MTLDTVDSLAAALQAQHGLTREDALHAARRTLGVQSPDADRWPHEIARDARIAEKEEQLEITKLFRAFGCTVRNLSQARASKQAPGLPDLWVTRRGTEVDSRQLCFGLAWWWESKRQVGGKRSPAQVAFGDDCSACAVRYGFGDRYDAAKFLVTIGVAVEDSREPLGIRPAVMG